LNERSVPLLIDGIPGDATRSLGLAGQPEKSKSACVVIHFEGGEVEDHLPMGRAFDLGKVGFTPHQRKGSSDELCCGGSVLPSIVGKDHAIAYNRR
jgi:hypothetical protein